jgi:uncharacterized protein with von Willebrand factor type A (vWA) domain
MFGTLGDALDATSAATDPQETNLSKSNRDAEDVGTEVFARLYGQPDQLDSPSGEVPWAETAHRVVDELPEFEALRSAVEGDPDFAAIATAELMQGIAKRLADMPKEEPKKDAQGNPQKGAVTNEDRMRASVRAACQDALEKVADGKEALAGLAPGLDSAPPVHGQEDPARMQLAERLLQDDRLRSVLAKAGRITRLAASSRRTRDVHARSEVVDVEFGNDIARLLPSHLGKLRHPMARKLAMRDLIERKAPQYRLEGTEVLGRGPIVLLLDRSGSMSGDPEQWASATAIALARQAGKERRPITIVEFTEHVSGVVRLRGQVATWLSSADPAVECEKMGGMKEVALYLASRASGGGTEFGPVMRYALQAGALDDRADLVFVTDGQASIDNATLEALNEAKKRGLRVYGLTVNGGAMTSEVKTICDVAVDLDKTEDVGKAIAGAFPRSA